MIIELCGLPGVGKTTLTKKLEQALNAEVVLLNKKGETLYYLLKGFLLHPRLYSAGLWWCLRHDSRLYFTWNFFCLRYAKLQKAYDKRDEIVLLDEGIVQNLFSYSRHKHSADELGYFKAYAQTIDRLVCVTLTEEERQAQILKRDQGQTNRRRQASYERDRVMLSNLEVVKQLCEQHPQGLVAHGDTVANTILNSISNHT